MLAENCISISAPQRAAVAAAASLSDTWRCRRDAKFMIRHGRETEVVGESEKVRYGQI